MATITDNDLKMFQERARTELASGCDVGSIAWDSVIWDLCNEVRRLRSASKERGDCAKLRESIEKIRSEAYECDQGGEYLGEGSDPGFDRIVKLCDAALAEPVRNCDVGTSDEQAERFENFCLEHIGCAEETGGRHCIGCPLEKASRHITQKCELYWAQLPYEEGDGDGEHP